MKRKSLMRFLMVLLVVLIIILAFLIGKAIVDSRTESGKSVEVIPWDEETQTQGYSEDESEQESDSVPQYNHYDIVIAQDGSGDFETIQEGIDSAEEGDTLLICEGTYCEEVVVGDKSLNIVGEDKENCVLVCNTDSYWTIPLTIAAGSVSNLTIYGSHEIELTEEEQERIAQKSEGDENEQYISEKGYRGYAVHIDSDFLYGRTLQFINCNIVSDNGDCVGIGARGGSEISFADCKFIANSEGGCLYIHDSVVSEVGGETNFSMVDCTVTCEASPYVFNIQSLSPGENKVTLTFINVNVNTGGEYTGFENEDNPYILTYNASGTKGMGWLGLNGYYLSEESGGNTLSEMNDVYPAPDYDFTTEEVTIEIEGLDEECTIAWVSDLHLISDFEAGDELGDVKEEYIDTLLERYETLPVTSDGMHADELWPEIVKYLNYNDFDRVIFGGDMMDYCSNSNIALIKEGLDSLRMPYIYVRADHDYGAYYGGDEFTETEARELHKAIDGDEISQKYWDLDDFLVLGIDSSTKDMQEYYLNMVADVFARGKPVVVATHVPYDPQLEEEAASLADLSMQVRNTIYYWSTLSDNYNPNTVTSEYLNLIYSENTAVCQVLAGHLHATWDGMLTEQVPEHIFGPAYGGNIGIIHIVPKN